MTQEAAAAYMHQIFGNITDIHVTRDVARWTHDFSPPTVHCDHLSISTDSGMIEIYPVVLEPKTIDLHTRILDL